MDADDGQASGLIFVMPTPQLRDDVFAIDSAIGPEFDQHHTARQCTDGEGFAVKPIVPGDIRRGSADGDRRASFGPNRPDRQREG